MTDWPEKSLEDWRKLAAGELKGADPDSLVWDTPGGIAVKPLYTAEDLEGLETLGSLPGFAPFTRGPKATMYAGRPWTLRQYAGRSEEHTSELQSLVRISYAVFCLKKKKHTTEYNCHYHEQVQNILYVQLTNI